MRRLSGKPGAVHLLEVLDKLQNGGLIVTDGSNHGHGERFYHDSRDNREYRSIWAYHGNIGLRPDPLPESFNDKLGNRFECVGYAGQRGFGPVLIWQVWKPEVQPADEPVNQEKRKPLKKTVRRRKPEPQHYRSTFERYGE